MRDTNPSMSSGNSILAWFHYTFWLQGNRSNRHVVVLHNKSGKPVNIRYKKQCSGCVVGD